MNPPLAGYRVLNLGRVWTGPIVGYTLAALGAEVIKLEHESSPDVTRLLGRPTIAGKRPEGEPQELSMFFHNHNRDCLGITLNLKTERGRELMLALAAKCNVVLENFGSGVMERLGLGYHALCQVRPGIIVAAISGVGQDGPLTGLRGYAPVFSSLSGLESLVGYDNEEAQGMLSFGLSDPNAGAQAVFAVLAAVFHHQETGQGQYIDMSQLEAGMAVLGEAMLEWQFTGQAPGPRGNGHRTHCPHGIFPCREPGCWVAIAVECDAHWNGLRQAMGDPPWAREPALQSAQGRGLDRERIERELDDWCRKFPRDELLRKLGKLDVPAKPVLQVEELADHPQFSERGLYQEVEHPLMGTERLVALPWKMSGLAHSIRKAAPLMGEDNRYVFMKLLGMGQEEFDKLGEDGVI
ncbi:MAG: CoA transferase [SAR324 cluster bacterium]|nr:CoA transferase [SAR324 cluster bacterium]